MDTGDGSSQIHYLNMANMVTVYASYIYDGQKVNVFSKIQVLLQLEEQQIENSPPAPWLLVIFRMELDIRHMNYWKVRHI